MSTSYPTGTSSASDSSKSFNILDHLDKLIPGKEKNKYICPVCEGHNLSVDPKTGAYSCYNSDCSRTDIREAIRPLAEFLAERAPGKKPHRSRSAATAPKKVVSALIPAGLKLLKLAAPQHDGPGPQKPAYIPEGVPASAVLITYKYSDTQEVFRYEWPDSENPKGHSKTYRQTHIDGDGKRGWTKGPEPWPAYRLDEVIECLAHVPDGEPVAVLMNEGEFNVELARFHGIATLTMQGSNWNHPEMIAMVDALRATGKQAVLVFLRDNDDTGIKKASEVLSVCNWAQSVAAGIPCVVIDPRAIYSDIPDKGDIREILENMDIEEFIQRLEAEIHAAATEKNNNNSLTPHPRTQEDVVHLSEVGSTSDYIPDTAPTPEQNYVQKTIEALYSDGHWVSVAGQLLGFTGTHYELRPEATEKRRILDWLSTYSELVKGKYRCNRANSASVNEVYSYMLMAVAVDPNTINPDGLNSSKGVVKINPDGSHSLVPHDPNHVYTYVGCDYDPDIDTTDCDRLLECLEPSQREVFLRTAAAALNLKLVRSKLTGRGVKGLLCHGEGSNGKDTLRAVLAAVFGRGMTGKSLSDFKSYDNGRKFSLAGIEGSICNWASENTAKVDLDTIQSLKQLITGDILDIERKGKDGYEYKPAAIFFANCNKLPSITGGTAAIDDRYGILKFEKTYKHNADPSQGELEADPRFKDDENFILERIAPAMLNKMLERLPRLLTEGIDYNATREAMREAQEESRHLWQFVREVGLEVQAGGRVWVKDLWEQLQAWYEDAGILEREASGAKEKLIWNELSNKYDAPVKAINQLSSRLSEIFPKLQVCKYLERDEMERRGQRYLLGIGFVQGCPKTVKTSVPSVPVDAVRDTAVPASVPKNTGTNDGTAQTLIQSGGTDGTDVSSPFSQVCNLLSQLTDSEWQKLVEILAQPQPQPEQPTSIKIQRTQAPKRPIAVGDRVVIVHSDVLMYRGVKGEVMEEWFLRDNKRSFTVKFDELVHRQSQGDFPEGDILRI